MVKTIVYSLALIALTACGKPQMNSQAADSALSDNAVSIQTLNEQNGQATVQVQVDGKEVTWQIDDVSGLQESTSNGASFDQPELDAIKAAAENYYSGHIREKEASLAEKASFQLLDYLSSAPVNHRIETRKYESLALANNGVSCVKKGSSVRAEWNTRSSSYVAENITVGANWSGGYGCMGRCGADCGWGAPSSWTKDCMDHDACSYRNKASGGGSDPNCGDEFNEAQDDWAQGVARGCSG